MSYRTRGNKISKNNLLISGQVRNMLRMVDIEEVSVRRESQGIYVDRWKSV